MTIQNNKITSIFRTSNIPVTCIEKQKLTSRVSVRIKKLKLVYDPLWFGEYILELCLTSQNSFSTCDSDMSEKKNVKVYYQGPYFGLLFHPNGSKR